MPPLDMAPVIVLDDHYDADLWAVAPTLTKKKQLPIVDGDDDDVQVMDHPASKSSASVRFSLTVVNDTSDRRIVELHAGDVLSIGRSSKAVSYQDGPFRVSFRNPVVSRQHATFELSSDQTKVMLMDVNSLHGTFVGDRRLEPFEKCRILSGDVLRFGCQVTKGLEEHSGIAVTFERLDTITPPRTPASASHAGFRVPSDSEESDSDQDSASIYEVCPPTSSTHIDSKRPVALERPTTPKRADFPEVYTPEELDAYSWDFDPDHAESVVDAEEASLQSAFASDAHEGLDPDRVLDTLAADLNRDISVQTELEADDEAPEVMSSKRAASVELGHPIVEIVQARDLDWKHYNDNGQESNSTTHVMLDESEPRVLAASMVEDCNIVQDSFFIPAPVVIQEIPETIQSWDGQSGEIEQQLDLSSCGTSFVVATSKGQDRGEVSIDHDSLPSNDNNTGGNIPPSMSNALTTCSILAAKPQEKLGSKKRKADEAAEEAASESQYLKRRKRARTARQRSVVPLTTFFGGAALGVISTITFLSSDMCAKLLEWHASL